MIRKMGEFFTRIMEKYLPDAYLFAIILTFISFILALIFTDAGFMEPSTRGGEASGAYSHSPCR